MQGTVGGVTTTYIGNYYEWTGEITTSVKYYYAWNTRMAMRVGDGTQTEGLYWLLNDHLGSTAVTAESAGNKSGEVRYKAWGETRFTSGSTPTTFRYTGQRQEQSLGGLDGLYYYGARWYDPALSRWIQPDTIIPEESQGTQAWDRYAYVNNRPVLFNDPTGHTIPNPPDCLYPFSNIYIPVRNGLDLIAAIMLHIPSNFIPVHFESYGPGEGAIVGDTFGEWAIKSITLMFFVRILGGGTFYQRNVDVSESSLPQYGPGSIDLELEDIFNDPSILEGKNPGDMAELIEEAKANGWEIDTLRQGEHAGRGLVIREVKDGKYTGRIIQWHPGGGHHGSSPYWKVSSPIGGTQRIGHPFAR